MMTDPNEIILAGDWHSNTSWAKYIISQLPEFLPDELEPTIIHVGDFGVWENGFIKAVSLELEKVNGKLWFIEGNHEDYRILKAKEHLKNSAGRIIFKHNVHWLPRNHRWVWHDKTWLALGGAISVDRSLRTEGIDVFKEEELSLDDLAQAVYDGPCDVLIAHDCPSMVPLSLVRPAPAAWLPSDLARADEHRERLNEIVEGYLKPELIVHGHYHLRQNWSGQYDNGKNVRVISLDMDGLNGNIVACDTKELVCT